LGVVLALIAVFFGGLLEFSFI